MFDVAIIGCGIVGAAAAYEFSKYDLSVAVLEKSTDVATGTTKANSAIVHAGYDPKPGTLMAKLNVRGSQLIEELAQKLDVEYEKIGSLVLAFDEDDLETIKTLYGRGTENGVPGLRILSAEETLVLEPNLSKEVKGALLAPSAAIVCPWELCIALAETAVRNGAQVLLKHEVTGMEKTPEGFVIHTNKEYIRSRIVINAAGVHADDVHNMVCEPEFSIIPSRGEYYVMDKNQRRLVNHVIFQCPTKLGKGVLVSPTVHGNLIVGPNAEDIGLDDDVATTSGGLAFVKKLAAKSVPDINYRESIRNFAGVRAASAEVDDFIIQASASTPGFIDLAGIKSPGLSSAPAIAEMAVGLAEGCGLALNRKPNFIDSRRVIRFKKLSPEQKSELVKKNPLYGRIICRCETVTEGEIVEALHAPIVPTTIDGIKRRCGAGLGRCQGGFCGPRVHEIIARELRIPMEQVQLEKAGSAILTGETKEAQE